MYKYIRVGKPPEIYHLIAYVYWPNIQIGRKFIMRANIYMDCAILNSKRESDTLKKIFFAFA